MGKQAKHEAGGEKSAPGRGHSECKVLDSGLRHMWDNHTPGWPTEGQAMVGEVRLERMGRRGADHREAQMLCVEKITLVLEENGLCAEEDRETPNPNPTITLATPNTNPNHYYRPE